MLKARKDYKDIVAGRVQTKQEKAVKAKMKNIQKEDSKVWKKQVNEFEAFLVDAIHKPNPFGFFVDMHKKLIEDKDILTENMEKAIRRCMERDSRKKKETDGKESDYPTITLKIKPFIMKDLKLDSRIITGKVKAESAKAWLIEGHADMLENMSWCVRCGRELTEPASQTTGMGTTCASKAGIPYDPQNVLSASKKKRDSIRKQYRQKLHNQTFERWIPKSQAEVFEG